MLPNDICRRRCHRLIIGCFLLLAAAINADATCNKGCSQSDNGYLQYTVGNVYEYSFDSIMTVSVNTGASGTNTDDTSLKIMGNAKIFAEGNCGYMLQLGAVKVSTNKEMPIEKKITQSIQKPIHFTMVNGKVEPVLCADESDAGYALNIKRAIVSLLQSNNNNGEEVDVFGQCPTHTSVSKEGNAEIVTKVRNLNACAYREQISSGIVNGIVNEKSSIRSTTWLQADYVKELKLERGVIVNVHLVEEYRFDGSGAVKDTADVRAKVVTTLKLKNPAGAPAPPPTSPSTHSASVIFQTPEIYTSKNIASLKSALSEIVELLNGYVQKDSAKNFVELIRLMRNADVDTLMEFALYPHPNKVLARKVYLDALFRTGTAESAKAIMKQLNKMEEKEKTIALLSLNLVETVDKETLNQAAALLTANAQKEVYLVVGTMVSKYCHRIGCEQKDIEAISKRLTDNLKNCKANTKKDEERIVYILKGIRNTQHLASNFSPVLTDCVSTTQSTRIRVAALQAFSAVSCLAPIQEKAMSLLKNRDEDSELRIEAYLALVECPNAEMANEISELVNSETVYQVGGFITSHLRAIRDSTDATREHQRYYLGNIRVTKHFPKDFRRYSFNNELSYKFDALGASASADYKFIYSQHGFLPRSARLNVSTEIFGTNFNVFEASIRQENIENILEYYLGPKGLKNKDFDEIMKLIEVGGGTGAGGRARRSIADDTAKFSKKYKTYGSKKPKDLNLDLSLKLFGSEIMFLSLGDNIPNSLDDVIMHFSTAFEDVKRELSSFSKEFVMHTLFMDTEFSYPTGLGIPLELSTQGFAANKLDFAVNIDFDAVLEQNWQQAKYRLKVVPSVDISMNVQLGFNAYVLTTGLRVGSSMHTATGGDMNFAFINEGNGFNMDIDLPREKLELIDVVISTDFFIAEQDKPIKSIALKSSKNIDSTKDTESCFNQLEAIGVDFCVSSTILDSTIIRDVATSGSGKNSISTLPLKFSIYMKTERKFNLKGYHIAQSGTGSQQWKLDFSTPGSKESHDTSLAFELGTKPRTFARISFQNPQVNFAFEAGINNDNKELVFYAQSEQNSDVKKSRIGFVKNGSEYRPVIEIQDKNGISNEINGYQADGKVVIQKTGDKQSRYIFENFQVMNKNNERIVTNGWADVGPASFNSELHVAPNDQAYFIQSTIKFDGGDYVIGLFVNDEKTPDNVIGGSATVHLGEQDYGLKLSAKAAAWEVDGTTELQYVKPEGSNVLSSSKFNHQLGVKHKQNVVGIFKVKGLTEENTKFQIESSLERGKKVTSLAVKYDGNQRAQGDYSIEVNGKMNKHFIDVIAKCDVINSNFVIDNVLTSSWGTTIAVKGELGQRYTLQDIHIDLQGTTQFSGKDKPTQWVLKAVGAPEKTTSEFKLIRDNADIVKYNMELQHPQDKVTAGKVNVMVKNVLNVKGDIKIAKNGKGEVTATIETQKTEPKHKIDINSKFHVQAPKYDIEMTMILDADKKIYLKTENIFDKLKFSTKNNAELANKNIAFEAKGEYRLNGEVQGDFELTCPDGRVIDGTLKRKMTTNAKTGVAQGSMDIKFNDQLPNGGQKRSLIGTGKIEKLNLKAHEFAVSSNFVYTNYDEKKIDITYHISHLPKKQNKFIDFGAAVTGDLLNTPVELSLMVDEYSSKHAVYHVSGKYGQHLSANVNGNYNVGEREQPATYELQGDLQMPESSFKTFEVKSNGKLMKPEAGDSGTYLVEWHIDAKTGTNHFGRFSTILKGSRRNGNYVVELETQQMQGPLKLDGSYDRELRGNVKEGTNSGKQKHTFNFNYADKYIKSTADMSYAGVDTSTLHYTLDTSFKSAKDIDIEIRLQKLEVDSYAVTAQGKQSGKNYAIDSKFFGASHKKGLDVHITLPSGQPIVVVGVFESLGERKAKLILEIENLAELDFKGSAEAAYKAIDDFNMMAQWNSKKLQLDNFDFEVRSQGKTITSNLKNAQGVVFAGTATYAKKNEINKTVIEGQGHVQYKGKTHNTNFKLIHQLYDISTDKEIGFSYTFNGNFGPKNGVATLKVTTKNFNVKLSMCEEKKQCTNVQVQSITMADEQEIDSMQHSLLILVDLRELGYPYEFEFQSKTIKHGLKLQYSLDSSIISNNNIKYQFVANVLPTTSKIQLKLPNREILFETQQQYPVPGHFLGHYENSAVFYFDKTNKPSDVTRIISKADITGVERIALNAKGVIQFEHPSIRPLTVSGKFDANRQQKIIDTEIVFDVFRRPEQEVIATMRVQNAISAGHSFNITSNQAIRSSGLGFHYELNGHTALDTEQQVFSAGSNLDMGTGNLKAAAYIHGAKDRIEVSLNALNEQILQLVGEFNRQKYLSKVNAELQIFGQHPVIWNSEIQPTMAKISVKREGIMDASAEIKLGKEVKFNVDGHGKTLFNGRVALDSANFLQTTYTSNENDIKEYLDIIDVEIKKNTEQTHGQIKKTFEMMRNSIDQQVKLAKESTPDLSQLKANYQNNVNEIVKELENDPSLKHIFELYRGFYTNVAKIFNDIAKTSAESFENLHKSFVALYEKLENILKDIVLPALEEFMTTAAKIVGALRGEILNIYTKAFQAILSVLEKYGPTLKNYGKAFNDAMKPFNEAFQELVKVSSHAIEEFITELKEYFAKLPTFEALRADIRAKVQQMKLVEKILECMNDIYEQLHVLPLTPETMDFLKKMNEYVEIKLKQEQNPINDEQLLDELLKLFVKAIRSLWTSLESTTPAIIPSVNSFNGLFKTSSSPFSIDVISKLPALLSFRFSVFNFLINENWSNIFSWNHFKSWIFFHDFELQGHIADGQNIFTFDGQHIAFPGTCKYILAQDSVDNNFTVIAQLNGGKMKSIILTDHDGNHMEISDTGVLKLNGNPSEFPKHENGMHAWRMFYTVWMHSEYGVQVMCTSDLKVCHVSVNGFYTSKTRGLLGNGNAEPNDDFVMVDGTIAPNYAVFGNDYALGKCNSVGFEPQEQNKVTTDICNELFGFESSLSIGALFMDVTPYRTACDRAVSAASEKDKENVACTIATAFASALKMNHHFIQIPARCLKCVGPPGQRDLGQEFSVKIPNNKADIVFVVDVGVMPTVLSKLVAPAITEVRESLKTRGFTDTQISVIAYNESLRYPALLTSAGGKINYNGNLAEEQLNGPKNFCSTCITQVVNDKKILEVYELLENLWKGIVPQSDEMAYKLALNYPFRAGSAKSIVAVRSDPLAYSNILKFVRAHVAGAMTKFDAALLHIMAPVKEMSLEGVPSEKLVGFNSRVVATLDGKDAKKRQKLQFENNMGIDFVLNNGGWVFSTQNFDSLKPQDQKKALNQVTNSIADTLFKTEIVSDCKCVEVHGLHAQHKCTIKSSNFVPNKKVKAA